MTLTTSRRTLAALSAAALVLGACTAHQAVGNVLSSSTGTPAGGTPSTGATATAIPTTATPATSTPTASTAPTVSASAGRAAHQLAAGTADNGHTVTLAVGDTLVVTLSSTYWQFRAAAPASVLHLVSSQITPEATQNGARCVPGQGCGTNTATFLAAASGQATVSAARTSCGEAMLCTGGQGTFTLTVVVTPA